jgi:hypothetical protein
VKTNEFNIFTVIGVVFSIEKCSKTESKSANGGPYLLGDLDRRVKITGGGGEIGCDTGLAFAHTTPTRKNTIGLKKNNKKILRNSRNGTYLKPCIFIVILITTFFAVYKEG